MAKHAQEIKLQRIIACFAPGTSNAPGAAANLAKQMQTEFLGLFIEDTDLLRFAALPFAAEVGIATAKRRSLDIASMERAFRAQAIVLRQTLAAAFEPATTAWSFRVERASLPGAIEAALAEGSAPTLLLPPGSNLTADRRIVHRADLGIDALRGLIIAARPVVILE